MLERARGHVVHMALSRVSPLAVPVLLEIGREAVTHGGAEDDLLAETAALVAEAMDTPEAEAAARIAPPIGGRRSTGGQIQYAPRRPAPPRGAAPRGNVRHGKRGQGVLFPPS